jgi:DNA-binding transcriptional ArsR family regulator
VSIANTDATGLAEIIRPIAHPDRIRLIELLGCGELTVTDLGVMLGLPATRVSQHLGILRLCRIVEARVGGRNRYYRLRSPEFAAWIAGLADLFGDSPA